MGMCKDCKHAWLRSKHDLHWNGSIWASYECMLEKNHTYKKCNESCERFEAGGDRESDIYYKYEN